MAESIDLRSFAEPSDTDIDLNAFAVPEKADSKPVEGGLLNSVKQTIGSTIKGAGQVASDFLGADKDNAVTRYGQSVVDANPTAVHSLEDIVARPGTAVAEAVGNAGGSLAPMIGAKVVGNAITAAAPLTGPAAPFVAAAGQVVSWLGPAAVAALPSFSGIRDKQALNNPEEQDSAKSKAIAALGAATVGAIESKFGPQEWALAAFTKEGRAELAKKFVATSLPSALGKGALAGAAIEGAEELVQNPIEQLASYDDPTTKENIKDTLFGGAMGAIGGGVLGGGVRGAQHLLKPTESPKPILEAKDTDEAVEAFRFSLEGNKTGIDLAEIAKTYKDHTPEEIAANQARLLKAFENDINLGQAEDGTPTVNGARLRAIPAQELPTEGEGLTRDAYEAIATLNRALGKKTVVYEDSESLPDGFVFQPDVVFVSNKTKQADPAVIAAHEVQHLSEQGEAQANYAKVVQEELTERAMARASERHEVEGPLSKARLMQEIRADIAGDAMADPTFHGRVIEKMREQFGDKVAEANATSLLDSIKQMIDRVKAILTGTTYTTPDGKRLATEYVNNLERVHDALAAAIADNFIREGYRPPGAQTNTSQMLVSQALAMQAARVEAENTPWTQRTLAQNKLLAAPPMVAPKGSSAALKAAIAAAQKAPFDRSTEERLNLEAVRLGVRMSPKANEQPEVGAIYEIKTSQGTKFGKVVKVNTETGRVIMSRLAKDGTQFEREVKDAVQVEAMIGRPEDLGRRMELDLHYGQLVPHGTAKIPVRRKESPKRQPGEASVRLTPDEDKFFASFNDADMADLKEATPSVRIEDGHLLVADAEVPALEDYISESWGAAKKAYGGEGAKSLPKSFAAAGDAFIRRLRSASDELKASPKKSDVGHKRTGTDGRYVGAPDWVGNSPQQLTALRAKLAQMANEGEAGRYWYEKSARAVLKFVGGDKEQAEKFVGLLALFSASNALSPNTTMALQAWYQWKAGVPIQAGRFPATQSKKAEAWLNRGEDYGGIKVNNFYQDLMEEIDPSKVDHTHSTMDMWMALAFDYGAKTLDQGPKYTFAQREVSALASKMGWKPHQVQAAIWTAMRARVMETEAKWKAREVALKIRERKDDGKPGEVIKGREYDHFRTVHRVALQHELTQAEVDASNADYATELAARTVQMSWEAEPGRTSGLLPGLRTATLEQKQEYLEAIIKALTDENGHDMVADLAGIAPGRAMRGLSAWEGVIGAGVQQMVPVHTEGAKADKKVAPIPRSALNRFAALRGYVLSQDAVVWHLPIYEDSAVRHNGTDVLTERPLNAEEMATLYEAVHREFDTWDIAPGYTDAGARLLNFVDGLDNARFQKGMDQIILSLPEGFGGGVLRYAGFRSDGEYIANNWQENPNGEKYAERLRTGRPDIQERAADLRARVAAVNRDFSQRYGWGQAEPAGAGRAAVDGGRDGEGVRKSPKQQDALDLVGVHFSSQPREVINGSYFGTGMKGAETERVLASKDGRLKSRVYAYVNIGQGVSPEKYVGGQPHVVQMPNLYDLDADQRGLYKPGDQSAFESAVLDAGFDGYFTRNLKQGVAVLIGPASSAVSAENKGSNYRGEDLPTPPAPQYTESRKAYDAFMADNSLPAGSMTGANWMKLVPGVTLNPDEVYYKDAVARKVAERGRMASPKSGEQKGQVTSLDSRRKDIFASDPDTSRAWKAIGRFDLAQPVNERFSTRSRDEAEREVYAKYLTKKDVLDAERAQGGRAANYANDESVAGLSYIRALLDARSGGTWQDEQDALRKQKPTEMGRASEAFGEAPDERTPGERAADTMRDNSERVAFARKSQEELERMAEEHAAGEAYADRAVSAGEAAAAGEVLTPAELDAIYSASYDRAYAKELSRLLQRKILTSPKSDAFRKWFGDSKVVDGNGHPLVVYHATSTDFNEFEPGGPDDAVSGAGIWLSRDPTYTPAAHNIGGFGGKFKDGTRVVPLYAKVENPLRITPENETAMRAKYGSLLPVGLPVESLEKIVNDGYDGIIYDREVRFPEGIRTERGVIVFRANQVKSAFNEGGFNPASNDFLRSPKLPNNVIRTRATQNASSSHSGDPSPTEAKRVEAALTGKTPIQAAKWLMETGDDVQKLVAERVLIQLEKLKAAGVKQELKIAHVGDTVPRLLLGARGAMAWDLVNDRRMTVWLNGADVAGKVGVEPGILLHELVHMAVNGAIQLGNQQKYAGMPAGERIIDITNVYKAVVKHFNDRARNPGQLTDFEKKIYQRANNAIDNAYELVAWALSDREAQAYLETIPYKGHSSAWTAFVSAVRALLGIPVRANTALSEILRVSENLMAADISGMIIGKGESAQVSGGPLLAPNGKPSNLPPDLYKLVRTSAFKKWFGDWEAFVGKQGGVWSDSKQSVSKVVDANGEPLVVFHGTTTGGFTEFSQDASKKERASFFTSDPATARSYSGTLRDVDLSEVDEEGYAPEQRGVYRVFLNIRNPNESDFEGANWDGSQADKYIVTLDDEQQYAEDGTGVFDSRLDAQLLADKVGGEVEDAPDRYESTDSVVREAINYGNDGAIIHNVTDSGSHGDAYDPTTVYAVLSPNQIKSVDNAGTFNPREDSILKSPKIVGASKRPYTAAQKRFFENVGRTVDEKSFVDKVKELRKDLGKKLAQGLVDQFAPLKELSPMAYMLARLSKGTAGAVEALLRHGKLKLVGSVYDADQSGGFVETVAQPLQGEVEDFLWWVAANRAETLKAEDRERLFSKSDIAAGKTLADGRTTFDYTLRNGTVTRDRKLIFADTLAKFDAFNKNVMDIAEQSGLIDGASRPEWERQFYVPFYRIGEEQGTFIGGKSPMSLVRQTAFKRLKGGEAKLNSDLLANTLKNWTHLIDASAKNRAAQAAIEAAVNTGVAVEADAATVKSMANSLNKKSATVWFRDNGVQRHFFVDDPFVMTAISSLEYAGMRNGVMDAMSTFKHILTVGVTASPAFKVKNLIRDSLQAVATSPISFNVVNNVKEGIAASDPQSQTYVSALASGGLIRFGTMLEGRQSDRVRQLVRQTYKDSNIINSDSKLRAVYDKFIDPAVAAYNELGNRSEEINRASLYKQLIKQGMPHGEAALLARDLMDFSLQGSWTGIRFLTQVVPFMNARMQGLYKLGRSAQEDPKRFASVVAATAMFSIALMAAYSDDDDWKKREDWDRDNYWWFKIAGHKFVIPKPFEIGSIATLAERGVEYFTSKEMTGERFRTRVMAMLSDTLSMNPVPQMVKPLLSVYANKDSFSGRPIETMGMERLQPDYRYTSRSSMLARGLSTAGQAVTSTVGANFVSPVQIDSMLRGYFGWLGTFVVGASDMAVRPMTSEPTRPSMDVIKFVTQDMVAELPADQSRYVSHMYEQAQQIERAWGTYQSLVKTGKREEAKEFLEDNRDKLVKYKAIERVKSTEAKLNERIRMIERSNKTPDEKREMIRAVNEQKDKIARLVY